MPQESSYISDINNRNNKYVLGVHNYKENVVKLIAHHGVITVSYSKVFMLN